MILPGQTLLYNEVFRGNAELIVRDLSRPLTFNLTRSHGTDEAGVWSPDGRMLAFISSRDGSRRLYVLSLDVPRGLRTVPDWLIGFGWKPVWSHDGHRLAFEVDDGRALQIAVLDVHAPIEAGTNPHLLTRTPTDNRFPAWAPHDDRLAYVSWSEGNAEIFLIPADRGEPVNLTQSSGWDTTPVWSPDGAHLAFYSDRVGQRELYVMEVATGAVRQLTTFGRVLDAYFYSAPAWSPDGQRIAFIAPIGMYGDVVIQDLNAEPGARTRLFTHLIYDTSPVWLPDSSGVIFMSYISRSWSLYAKPIGQAAFPLTDGAHDAGYASWWPRG